jgi:hypothetical protein
MAYKLSRIDDPTRQAELAREAMAGRLRHDHLVATTMGWLSRACARTVKALARTTIIPARQFPISRKPVRFAMDTFGNCGRFRDIELLTEPRPRRLTMMADLNRIEYTREVQAQAVRLRERLEGMLADDAPKPSVEDLTVKFSILADIVKDLARSHRELLVIVLQFMEKPIEIEPFRDGE